VDATTRRADGLEPSMTDTILLSIPTTPRLRSVATLVLGGMGSRLHLPYEKVDDLQLAAISVLSAAADDSVTLELSAADDSLSVDIGPLAKGSASDQSLKRVLERLVDGVEASERDGRDWLTLRLDRPDRAS
jgi:hypothetical protein